MDGHGRVGQALLQVQKGLRPFVEAHMKDKYGADWQTLLDADVPTIHRRRTLDAHSLLKIVVDHWRPVFSKTLRDRDARNIVGSALDLRNRYAHAAVEFTDFEALDALGTLIKLLTIVEATKEHATVLQLWQAQRRDEAGSIETTNDTVDRRSSSAGGRPSGRAGAQSNSLVVELVGPTGFKRTYYGPIVLTRSSFRGAAPKRDIDRLDGTGLEVWRDGNKIFVCRQKQCPPCRIDGAPIRIGVRQHLDPGEHRLEIIGVSLQLTAALATS
jgi:Swt1-like HEPN